MANSLLSGIVLRSLIGFVCAVAFFSTADAQTPSRVSQYSATPFLGAWNDIASTGDTFHYTQKFGYGTIAMPFDFPYDDSIVRAGTKIFVCASGAISLVPNNVPLNEQIDSPAYPGLIGAFSSNLITGNGMGVDSDFYEVDGAAPNRVLTVEYHDSHFPGGGSGSGNGGGTGTGGGGTPLKMQVKFYETSGTIEFLYENHDSALEPFPTFLAEIGLNGFSTPSFVSNVYETNRDSIPTTDIRWTPGASIVPTDSIAVRTPFNSPSCGADTAIISVMNRGTTNAMYIVVLSGSDIDDFTLVSPSDTLLVAPGSATTVKIAFSASRDSLEPIHVDLFSKTDSGQFPAGNVTLSPMGGAAVITGSGMAPVTPATRIVSFPVTIHNTGTCPWTPDTAVVSLPFLYDSGARASIAPGGTGILYFSFYSDTAGSFTEQVSFPNAIGLAIPAPDVTLSGEVPSAVSTVSEMDGYSLGTNYPNPFNTQTDITLTLPEPGNVRLSMVDANGETVEQALNQHFDAGTFNVKLDASAFPSGTYYYQMSANGVTLTRQMTVIK